MSLCDEIIEGGADAIVDKRVKWALKKIEANDHDLASAAIFQNAPLMAVLGEVEKAISQHLATAPVFRSKLVGNDGSASRRAQADSIYSEDELKLALAKLRELRP